MERKKSKNKWLILLILLLICFVSVTTVIYMDRMDNFLLSDDGALPITGEDTSGTVSGNVNANTDGTTDNVVKPGFVIYDDNGIWNMESSFEVFRISYENGEQVVTAVSSDGDKIIAPGTDFSYTFKLKNTGNVALDYDLEVKTFISHDGLNIPIQGKMNRFDGKWVYGDSENWEEMNGFDIITDSYTLGTGRYSYYVFDWQWPFEGNDELDTYLGNLAAGEEIVYKIEIHTIATVSDDPNAGGGIQSTPNTGDNSQILLYAAIGGCALIFILILILKLKDDEDEENEK